MSEEEKLTEFLRSTFRSIWALELLLLMMSGRARHWSRSDLVTGLRASDQIVDRSLDDLASAGLVLPEQEGCFRYAPISSDLEALMAQLRDHYRNAPDAVRRTIIRGQHDPITAFSDAFRIRQE